MMSERRAVTALLFAYGFEALSTQVLAIYIPLRVLYAGGEETVVSLLRATVYAGPVFLGYYIGTYVDRFDKRFMGGSIGAVLAFVVIVYSAGLSNYSVLESFVLLSVVSVGAYALSNMRVSLLSVHSSVGDLPRINARLVMTENTSLIFSPLIVSILLGLDEPAPAVALIGLGFFFSSILYRLGLPSSAAVSRAFDKKTFRDSMAALVRCTRFLRVVMAVMGVNALVGIYLLFLMIFAVEINVLDQLDASRIFVAHALGAIASGVVISKIMDVLDASTVALACVLLALVSGLIPIFFRAPTGFYVGAFMMGLSSSAITVAAWTLRQTLLSGELLGRVTGITSALFKLAMLVSVPLAGLLSKYFNSILALAFGLALAAIGVTPLALETIGNWRESKRNR